VHRVPNLLLLLWWHDVGAGLPVAEPRGHQTLEGRRTHTAAGRTAAAAARP
jgi:hypothetical protein